MKRGKTLLAADLRGWLYDEGEDEGKAVSVAKPKQLETLGKPVLAVGFKPVHHLKSKALIIAADPHRTGCTTRARTRARRSTWPS